MAFTFLTSLVLSSIIAALYYTGFNIDTVRTTDHQEDKTAVDKVYHVSHPLFLTPLIENGNIDDARRQAIVEYEGLRDVISYSGFLTVDEEYNSNTFFWFFPAEISSNSAPLIIWLQGHPGESSLLGLFTENGPFYLTKDRVLQRRKTSWSEPFNVLYIDNPIGAGFSFTDNEYGYNDNQLSVGIHLYEAVKQFFKLFPELRPNDVYIASEAYGGKFATAFGYAIHCMNPLVNEQINFKGLMIFDGYLDPVRGVAQEDTKKDAQSAPENSNIMTIDDIMKAVAYEKQVESFIEHPGLMSLDQIGKMVSQATDFITSFGSKDKKSDPVYESGESSIQVLSEFLDDEDIKHAIHVGNRSFVADSEVVRYYLAEDMSVTLGNVFAVLLNNYKILIANGELDATASAGAFEESLMKLNWNYKNSFRTAVKKSYTVDEQSAGDVKTAGNLVQIVVKNVKESVIKEEPVWALDFVSQFVTDGKIGQVV